MFIQGSLQAVFDALYMMGKIDPALKQDWSLSEKDMKKSPEKINKILQTVNACHGDTQELVAQLEQFDDESLLYLTMEVAREYVDFECTTVRH